MYWIRSRNRAQAGRAAHRQIRAARLPADGPGARRSAAGRSASSRSPTRSTRRSRRQVPTGTSRSPRTGMTSAAWTRRRGHRARARFVSIAPSVLDEPDGPRLLPEHVGVGLHARRCAEELQARPGRQDDHARQPQRRQQDLPAKRPARCSRTRATSRPGNGLYYGGRLGCRVDATAFDLVNTAAA